MLALEEIGIKVASPPAGGYYIWGQLPLGTDEMAVARSAAEKGIFLAPGTLFVPDRSAQPPAMRINVAYAGDPRFIEFMRDRLNA